MTKEKPNFRRRSYSFRKNQTGGEYDHTLSIAQVHSHNRPGSTTNAFTHNDPNVNWNAGDINCLGGGAQAPVQDPFLVVNCIIKT